MAVRIDPIVLSIALVALATVLALTALFLVVLLRRHLRPAPRPAPDDRGTADRLMAVERRLADLAGQVREVRDALDRTVQHVGMVRYDAFQDLGGQMSFSLALLDRRRTGVVVSVLNGRDGSRGYAKAVVDGRPTLPLSEEEAEAVARALGTPSA